MKIDPSIPLLDLVGAQIKMGDGAPATLGSALSLALLTPSSSENGVSGTENFARYLLAQRLHRGDTDYSVEDLAKMKELSGNTFAPGVLGPIWILLDPPKKDNSDD